MALRVRSLELDRVFRTWQATEASGAEAAASGPATTSAASRMAYAGHLTAPQSGLLLALGCREAQVTYGSVCWPLRTTSAESTDLVHLGANCAPRLGRLYGSVEHWPHTSRIFEQSIWCLYRTLEALWPELSRPVSCFLATPGWQLENLDTTAALAL